VNPYYAHVLIMFCFYAYLALAWNIVGGYAGQLSLGHAVFYGLGAYTSTLLFLHLQLSPWIGMLAGGALAAVASVLIGYPCFRLRGPFFAMSTLAVLEVFRILAVYASDLTGGSTGLSIPIRFGLGSLVFRDKMPYLGVIVGLLVVAVAVSVLIERSRFGHRLVALRENEDAAESCGVNVRRVKLTAMVLSAFLTAIAGSFYAQYVLYIDPSGEFSMDLSVLMAMMAILGGAGTVLGPILGAAVLAPLQEFLRAWLGGKAQGLHLLIYGILIIAVVKFLPRGILAWLRSLVPWPRAGRSAAGRATAGVRAPGTPAVIPSVPGAVRPDVPLLVARGLRKAFGGLVAVNGVDIEVRAGEILSVIGPNGAGKTTLFNLLSGVYRADAGSILYRGVDVTGVEPHYACGRGIARTFQIPKPFADVTVLENVVVGALSRTPSVREARAASAEVLALVGLAERRDTLASSLTPGDQKRLELARALATRPSLLMLDELMAGLTPTELGAAMDLLGRIRGLGVTIVLVEHVMQVVMQISDRVIVLHLGEKIAEGPPAAVAADARVVTAYLGDEYAVA
jgi:branched-chain amino acid transport system permease protein